MRCSGRNNTNFTVMLERQKRTPRPSKRRGIIWRVVVSFIVVVGKKLGKTRIAESVFSDME